MLNVKKATMVKMVACTSATVTKSTGKLFMLAQNRTTKELVGYPVDKNNNVLDWEFWTTPATRLSNDKEYVCFRTESGSIYNFKIVAECSIVNNKVVL